MFPFNVVAAAAAEAVPPGAEQGTAVIRATDPGALFVEDDVIFTIIPEGILLPPTIIVQANGLDGADHATVQAALDVAVAGDIIEIRSNVASTEQQYIETLLLASNGTDGNEIIIRGRINDKIRIFSNGGFTLDPLSFGFWKFFNLEFGDADLTWLQSDAGRSVSSSRNLEITGTANHLDFVDCFIWGGSLTGGTGNRTNNNNTFVRFLRCDFDLAGSNNDLINDDDRGDLMRSESTETIFDECTFAHGGHDMLAGHGAFTVIRGCTSDANWIDKSTGFPGARGMALSAGGDNGTFGVWGPQLIEDSVIKNVAPSVDQDRNNMIKLEGTSQIFRGNFGWDCEAGSISAADNPGGFSQVDTIKWHRVYHNTMYNNGSMLRILRQQAGEDNWLEMKYKNNICDQMTGLGQQDGDHIYFDTRNVPTQGYPDGWIGAEFAGNIVKAAAGNVSVYLRTGAETSPPHDTVAQSESNFPDVWIGGNTEDTPVFVDAAARTKAGFALLNGSPGVGEAEPLTTIINPNADDVDVITVADARYFYDGWNMAYFGEDTKMDVINIVPPGGDPNTDGQLVQIAYNGINYDNGVIELTSTVSIRTGDEIYWENRINKGAVG